jgi:hypothetical protein
MHLTSASSSRTALVTALLLGATAPVASAGIIVDDFSVSAQSAFTTATTNYTASLANQNSAWNESIFQLTDAKHQRAISATWSTRFSENQTLSQAARLARSAGAVVDTTVGRANLKMDGRISSGSTGLTYRAAPGGSLDLAGLTSGIRIEGGLTSLTGFSNPITQGLSLQVLLTDNSGDSSSFTWYGNTTAGGFNGLDGTLETIWSNFQATNPGDDADLSDIAAIDVRLFYSHIGMTSSPTISASYSMDSIVLVPAPAAVALLAVVPFFSRRRRS